MGTPMESMELPLGVPGEKPPVPFFSPGKFPKKGTHWSQTNHSKRPGKISPSNKPFLFQKGKGCPNSKGEGGRGPNPNPFLKGLGKKTRGEGRKFAPPEIPNGSPWKPSHKGGQRGIPKMGPQSNPPARIGNPFFLGPFLGLSFLNPGLKLFPVTK